MVRERNIQERFISDEETWPPDQPTYFTPLTVIYQDNCTLKQTGAIIPMILLDDHSSVTNKKSIPKHRLRLESYNSIQDEFRDTFTKEFMEIIAPLEQVKDPQLILIEGPPGIGKSILLKEIAYRWAKKQVLITFKLVLLVCLRDPAVQCVSYLEDLLQLFYNKYRRSTQIATACSDYLDRSCGRDVVFLFDGFDEYPDTLQKNGLIADILKRKVLPNCALVLSSRPHTTVHLQQRATVRMNIWGFSEIEQNHFIQQAFNEQPQSIKEITQFLQHHANIRSLCTIPFNMVVLLFLYKQGVLLPKNSAQLYNYFICLTIRHHLAKSGHCLENKISELVDFPYPHNGIIKQLSKLALEALKNNKSVFTFDDINMVCADITTIPGAINEFGLLQAVQDFGITGKTMIFNFLHSTIQEYLAAYQITKLKLHDELKVLEEFFWNDSYSNVFAIYLMLTVKRSFTFTKFIIPFLKRQLKIFLTSEESATSKLFLDNQLRILHLFQCIFEAGYKEIYKTLELEKVFVSKKIDLNTTILSPNDVECVALFLIHSSQREWKRLLLSFCYIQDDGFRILHHKLTSYSTIIEQLGLRYNGLSKSCSSDISNIVVHCAVKVLNISGNKTVGEDAELYSMIKDPSSILEVLHMRSTKLTSSAAIKLFTALCESKKLKELWIHHNEITDDACPAIIMAL